MILFSQWGLLSLRFNFRTLYAFLHEMGLHEAPLMVEEQNFAFILNFTVTLALWLIFLGPFNYLAEVIVD